MSLAAPFLGHGVYRLFVARTDNCWPSSCKYHVRSDGQQLIFQRMRNSDVTRTGALYHDVIGSVSTRRNSCWSGRTCDTRYVLQSLPHCWPFFVLTEITTLRKPSRVARIEWEIYRFFEPQTAVIFSYLEILLFTKLIIFSCKFKLLLLLLLLLQICS